MILLVRRFEVGLDRARAWKHLHVTGAVRDGAIQGSLDPTPDLGVGPGFDGWRATGPFVAWSLLEYLDRVAALLDLVHSPDPEALLDCPRGDEWRAATPWYAPMADLLSPDLSAIFKRAHELEKELTARSR